MEGDRIKSGRLTNTSGRHSYPIYKFIPRFVDDSNYADNFGLEWKTHSRTQFDDTSKHSLSRDRFFGETGWPENLTGEVILEAGSGSGRFTEHALATGATVCSFDYSEAVEANYASNGQNQNLLLVQANIFEPPFETHSFDRIFCFGVLQHTPDPESAFKTLPKYAKPGGYLATDIYLKKFTNYYLNTRYWVRPLTRRMQPEKLYGLCVGWIDLMWPLARIIRKFPKYGEAINWRLLIADYASKLPDMDDASLKEWAYLDTFDMLSPRYDLPQTPSTFRAWHEQAELIEIDVAPGPNGLSGRARIPNEGSA